jgi:hypothetical protein
LIVLALFLLVAGVGAFAATGTGDPGTGIIGVIGFAMWVVAALLGWAGWRLAKPRRSADETSPTG